MSSTGEPTLSMTAAERQIVLALLQTHLPDTTAWVYGSRATGTAGTTSDLDLVVFATVEQMPNVGDLRDAFDESNLPFRVDLFVWDALPEDVQSSIRRQHVVLLERTSASFVPATPDRWRQLPFSDAVQINPAVPLRRGSDYPYVDMAALSPGSRRVVPSMRRRFKGGGSQFAHRDTLMARITPCLENGKIAQYMPLESNQIAHGSTELIVIRGRSHITDSDFAYYLTQSDDVKNYAIEQMTGTSGRQRVPTSCLKYLNVSIPPIEQQRTVADVLGTLDDKIDLNRRRIETQEAIARAIFQDWFVDFGPTRAKMNEQPPYLPSYLWALFPHRFAASPAGDIPAGWRIQALNTVAEHLRATEHPQKTPQALFQHFSIPAFDDQQTPKTSLGAAIKSVKSRVSSDTVLLSRLNPDIERVWMVDLPTGTPAVCSTEYMVLRARPPFTRAYLYCLLRSPHFRQQIGALVTGTSRSHQRAPAHAVLSIPTPTPPVPLIDAFNAAASDLLTCGLARRREISTLAKCRDELLPNLLRGRVQIVGCSQSHLTEDIPRLVRRIRIPKVTLPRIENPSLLLENAERVRLNVEALKSLNLTAARQARTLAASMEIRFVLPKIGEAAALFRKHMIAMDETIGKYRMNTEKIRRAFEAMTVPWLDTVNRAQSAMAFAKLQGIGHALRRMPAFRTDFTETLRLDLGDWRRNFKWPSGIIANPAKRTIFYKKMGLNPALTGMPADAFEQSLSIARIKDAPSSLFCRENSSADRLGSASSIELSRNNEAHDLIQKMETKLRDFIEDRMVQSVGSSWYKRRIDHAILQSWREKRKNSKSRREADIPLIAFADFTDYERIILRKDNWNELFQDVFGHRESVMESFRRLRPIRVCVMHARMITQDDQLYLYVEVKRILSAINEANRN